MLHVGHWTGPVTGWIGPLSVHIFLRMKKSPADIKKNKMNNQDIIPLTPTHGNNTTAAAAPVGAPPLPTTTTTTTIGITTSSSFKWTEEALIALAEEVGNC